MRVIVTGGNGFLGSNIVRKFLREGHDVMVLSNNNNNIQDILDRVEYHQLSSNQLKEFLYPTEEKIDRFSPDILIHCAWAGGNKYQDVNSSMQFHDNISLGIRLVNCLRNLNKPVKFIGLGSFSEYGKLSRPANEDDQENPVNLYGLSKYSFKMYSKMLCEQNSIDWVWMRPCYVFGKGDVSTRLIPRLIAKFSNNERIELDECTSVVDYIHIDDFCDIFYELAVSSHKGVFNVCSGKQYEIKYLIETLRKLLKSNSEIVYNKELNRNLPTYVCGDNQKALNASKMKLNFDIEKDILKTIN